MTDKIWINFVIEGKDYAARSWPAVPRIGEHVSLNKNGEKTLAIVKLVVWGVREETAFGKRLECDVHVLWDAPEIPKP